MRWTSESVRELAAEPQEMGHSARRQLVADLLHAAGCSLQANQKARGGPGHPDRDAQFRHINRQVLRFQRAGQRGDFKNPGREWQPKGSPERVRVYDVLIPEQGKALSHGIHDLTRNARWVSVGIDHDTASSAVHSSRRWWEKMGRPIYGQPTRCWSRPIREGATGRGCGSGSGNFSGWRTRRGFRSRYATSHTPARASGTRSSTASSRTSAPTGVGSPLSAWRWS